MCLFQLVGNTVGLQVPIAMAEYLGALPLLVILVPWALGILLIFPPGPAAGYLHVMMTLIVIIL